MEALEVQVQVLKEGLRKLNVLVDGHESWSHRSRLAAIERDASSRELAERTLGAYKRERDRLGVRVREWGSFALALTAIILTLARG